MTNSVLEFESFLSQIGNPESQQTLGYDNLTVSYSYTLADDNHIEGLHLSNKGNFSLRGNNDANFLDGNSGKNTLLAEAGDDILLGRGGADYLTGGEGADMFRLLSPFPQGNHHRFR